MYGSGQPYTYSHTITHNTQDFHSKYYHPSNARFWFHGDDEPVERLRILSEYLDQFQHKEVHTHPIRIR